MNFKTKFKIKKENIKKFIQVNIWVQKFRFKSYKGWYFYDILMRIVGDLSPMINTYIVGLIINYIQINISNGVKIGISDLYPYLIAFILINILNRIIQDIYWQFYWYFDIFNMERNLENQIISNLNRINWEHIESPEMEKMIHMSYKRTPYHLRELGKNQINFIALGASLIFALYAAKISLWIILIIAIKELPSIIISAKVNKRTHKLNDKLQNNWTTQEKLFWTFKEFSSLLEIKISKAFNPILNIYEKNKKHIQQEYHKKDRPYDIPLVLTGLFENTLESGIFFYYIWQVLYNNMLFGTFSLTTGLISRLGTQFYYFLTTVNKTIESFRYVTYAYDLIHFENRKKEGTKELKGDNFIIEFNNVSFKYPGDTKYVLKDINLTINDNDRIALVGENGAGKSTFLKLLTLLYYPTKGEILVNGVSLEEYKKESVYDKLAVVTQDFNRYSVLNVWQNISLFDYKNGKRDNKRIEEAAKLAQADSFIQKLPNTYDTLLSKALEGGEELSTGQWQRLAVARQFYANRPIIILDEPTSAIDPIAEANIFNNLYHHVKDKTVIVVSHRYNTVRAAQQILVFKDGQIIERGTHDELVAKNGYYAEAFEMQNTSKKL